ncbi:MAG: hypothetical protein ABEJ92_00075 [Halobacteriales archaeon]
MPTGPPAPRPDAVPALEPGVTLLRGGPTPLHRVVAAELARGRTAALWVDPGRAVSTHALYDLAPSKRTLRGLRVARAFTAYQHHALCRELVRRASSRTQLVVLPGVGRLYRDDDVPDYEREALFEAAVSVAAELASSLSVPVLLADDGDDGLTAIAADHADAEVDVEATDMGLAFRGAGFETLGYWGHSYWQTTIPYWVDLFGARDPEEPLASADGPAQAEFGGPAVPALGD